MSKQDKLLRELIKLCEQRGMSFASLYQYSHLNQFVATAHDPSRSGKEPKVDEMRDEIDYHLEMDSWYRRGLVILAVDKDPYKTLEMAIEYLRKQ